MKDESDSKKIIPDPETAPIVKRIFEMFAHGPIVDRMTFDLVQKHFEGRKRPDKRGEMDMFAGYLYCADCGARMYLRRGEINNYSCSGHSKRGTDCTSSHYIRASEVEKVVLAALRQVTSYARENSDKFYEQAMQRGEEESKKLLRDVEKQQTELNSRIKQLDNIIATLYEDRVIGRLSPERYDQLSAKYEQEQAEIKAKLADIESRIDRQKLRESCIRSFIQSANRYIDMPKLTPELLRTFIKRIEIHEKEHKFSRSCGNRIDIYFTFAPESGMIADGTECAEETQLLAG